MQTVREQLERAYALANPDAADGRDRLTPRAYLDVLENQASAILGIFRELYKIGQLGVLRQLIRSNGLEDEPVNWARLGYCAAEFDINSGWTILTVTGASPDAQKLAGWLEDTLATLGWHELEVVCEW